MARPPAAAPSAPARRSRLTFAVFGLVGVLNTALDFALYYILFNSTGSIIIANVVSTTAALIFSYLINSRYTFKSKQWTVRSFAAFLAVTVFGLWVLQTGAIYIVSHYTYLVPATVWDLFGSYRQAAKTLFPKFVATSVTFIWNYLWYSRVIFKNEGAQKQIVATVDEL